jgi:O-methyltransferase
MHAIIRFIGIFFFKCINALSTFFANLFSSNYQLVLPYATYAPWLKDKLFNNIYATVKKDALVVKTQAYELWQLVEETHHLHGDIIEIGTWRGASLIIMATKMASMQSSSTIYGCDTFEGVVKSSHKDNYYKDGMHSNTTLTYVQNRIAALQLSNIVLCKGIFPNETGNTVTSTQFRLCHLDVDTYQSAKDCVDFLWPKITIGGIMVCNDYGYPRTKGITQFVNELRQKNNSIVIHNLNGNAIIVKTN